MCDGEPPGATECRSRENEGQVEPAGEGLELVDDVRLADEPIPVQHGQRPVAPDALRGWLVHLERVVVLEDLREPLPVEHQAVERRQQRRATLERLVHSIKLRRVDLPRPSYALDGRLYAHRADVVGLDRRLDRLRSGDTERGEPTAVAFAGGLGEGYGRDVGVDAFRQVPPGHRALSAPVSY